MLEQVKHLCRAKAGAHEKLHHEWEAFHYSVCEKMFALIGEDKHREPILSLKCEVQEAEHLRDMYADIQPGYYLNKKHWISIYYERGTVPVALIEQLVDNSYTLVFRTLSRKKQAELVQAIK